MAEVALVALTTVMMAIGLFGAGRAIYYTYLSWFDPDKLRRIEIQRLERSRWLLPRLRAIDAQIERVSQAWWLNLIRVVGTTGILILLIGVVLVAIDILGS